MKKRLMNCKNAGRLTKKNIEINKKKANEL